MALLTGGSKNSSMELLEFDELGPDKYPGSFWIPGVQNPEQEPCQILLLWIVCCPHNLGQVLGAGSWMVLKALSQEEIYHGSNSYLIVDCQVVTTAIEEPQFHGAWSPTLPLCPTVGPISSIRKYSLDCLFNPFNLDDYLHLAKNCLNTCVSKMYLP